MIHYVHPLKINPAINCFEYYEPVKHSDELFPTRCGEIMNDFDVLCGKRGCICCDDNG
jgi:hypothetical protein